MRNVTGQVDLTRMKPAHRGSPELWRVGSGRVGSGRVGSGVFQISRVGSSQAKTCRNSRGSGRDGSRRLEILAGRVGSGQDVSKFSPVGSGPVRSRRLEILAGRIGSGQEVSKLSRVGSGQLTRPDPLQPDQRDLTRPVKSPHIFALTFFVFPRVSFFFAPIEWRHCPL